MLHVDKVMTSHGNPKFNDNFKEWMNSNHGKHGKFKANRGKLHDYLVMTFDFTENQR